MLTKKEIKKLENMEVCVLQNDKNCIELEFYSDCGEDFVFSSCDEESIKSYCEYFDPEEHANSWYGANNGEPSSLRTLLDDAESIAEKLDKIANVITIKDDKTIKNQKYYYMKQQYREEAINWQLESSNKNYSYGELLAYDEHFLKVAKKYGLVKEFKENAIL